MHRIFNNVVVVQQKRQNTHADKDSKEKTVRDSQTDTQFNRGKAAFCSVWGDHNDAHWEDVFQELNCEEKMKGRREHN